MPWAEAAAAALPAGVLAPLADLIAERFGLGFPRDRWDDLARAIGGAADELGAGSAADCARGLLDRPWDERQTAALAARLTVGETYFFRNSEAVSQLLPAVLRARPSRRLRVWSAGCATGEEAYTLAMLLDMAVPDLDSWDIAILGTDINRQAVAAAERGVFRPWSFRSVPAVVRDHYFAARDDGSHEIQPRLRRLVRFAAHNLAEGRLPAAAGPGGFDLVLCRHVLMYFSEARAGDALALLAGSLAEDGWLLLDPLVAPRFGPGPAGRLTALDVGLYRRTPLSTPLRPSERPRPRPERLRAAPARPPVRDRGPAAPAPRARTADLIAEAPADPVALAALARMRANAGALAEARRWASRAVAADPLDPWCHYVGALIDLELEAAAAARAALERALFLAPDFALAHVALARLAQKAGQQGRAERHLSAAAGILSRAAPDTLLDPLEAITAASLADLVGALRDLAGRARA